METRRRRAANARLLVARLERLSVDSFWAHQASGLRGSLLRALEGVEADHEPEADNSQLEVLLGRGFAILNRAAREMRAPAVRFSKDNAKMSYFKDYRNFTGSSQEKFFKSTLFQSGNLLLGLNCLEPGQSQPEHAHAGQDKFYFVLEGQGEFSVGEESRELSPGFAAWAPAGVPHGVRNAGDRRLVILVGIAPAPG